MFHLTPTPHVCIHSPTWGEVCYLLKVKKHARTEPCFRLQDRLFKFWLFHVTKMQFMQANLVMWGSAVREGLTTSPPACFGFLVVLISTMHIIIILRWEVGPWSPAVLRLPIVTTAVWYIGDGEMLNLWISSCGILSCSCRGLVAAVDSCLLLWSRTSRVDGKCCLSTTLLSTASFK